MSLNAATIEVLLGKGLSGADLLEVARAMERRTDYTANERQKRCRANKKISASHRDSHARDVSPNERDNLTPSDSPVVSDETTPSPELKIEHVVEAWNDLCADFRTLKPVSRLTPGRRKRISTRIAEETVDDFTEAIDSIRRSPFLRGDSDRGWRATFDWMLKPENFTKLVEGNYDR